jgi:hypothetical protein
VGIQRHAHDDHEHQVAAEDVGRGERPDDAGEGALDLRRGTAGQKTEHGVGQGEDQRQEGRQQHLPQDGVVHDELLEDDEHHDRGQDAQQLEPGRPDVRGGRHADRGGGDEHEQGATERRSGQRSLTVVLRGQPHGGGEEEDDGEHARRVEAPGRLGAAGSRGRLGIAELGQVDRGPQHQQRHDVEAEAAEGQHGEDHAGGQGHRQDDGQLGVALGPQPAERGDRGRQHDGDNGERPGGDPRPAVDLELVWWDGG